MKTHHKNGLSAAVAPRAMRPRLSRHGKPLADVYTVHVPAVVERKTVLNPDTDQYEVVNVEVSKAYTRPMTPAEVKEARDSVLRATEPTTSGWRGQVRSSTGKKAKVAS